MNFLLVLAAVLLGLASFSEAEPDEPTLVDRLREDCLIRGCSTIRGIGKRFKITDKNRDWVLSPEEFRRGIQHFHLQGVTVDDANALFQQSDTDASDTLDYEEFIKIFKD